MKYGRTAAALVAATALVAPAAPATAASHKTVVNGHVSGSLVAGALPVGAGITVIQYCPVGSDLDRAATRAARSEHDISEHDTRTLRVASREYWPAGLVTRYTVRRAMRAGAETMMFSFAVCKSYTRASATRFAARAKVDLRVWGPAPARVALTNVAFVGVSDDISSLEAGRLFRSSIAAAGVDSHPQSLRGAVQAAQQVIEDADVIVPGVGAAGMTDRKVARGQFVSMRNHYRFAANLTKVDQH